MIPPLPPGQTLRFLLTDLAALVLGRSLVLMRLPLRFHLKASLQHPTVFIPINWSLSHLPLQAILPPTDVPSQTQLILRTRLKQSAKPKVWEPL